MGHVALLGDSIFDNAGYVPGGLPVVEQLKRILPSDWRVTLLAVDGHVTKDVAHQLAGLPDDATHLIVSAGGNDALCEQGILTQPARTVGEALALVGAARVRFRRAYRSMLDAVATTRLPTVVCTIYECVPGIGAAAQTALSVFNEVILSEACAAGIPVIDLRILCADASDYSTISPIEPSETGGWKIVRCVAAVATTHDFRSRQCVLYA